MKNSLWLTILLLITATTSHAANEINQALFDKGRAVFDKLCVACHNYAPPPNKAPPMLGISGHYHDAFSDRDQAVAHIVDYLKKPAPEKSMLMPMAIRVWGLMVPPPLSVEESQAVAYWVWEILNVECSKSLASPPCQRFLRKQP